MKIGVGDQLITLGAALALLTAFVLGLFVPRSRTLSAIVNEDKKHRQVSIGMLEEIEAIDDVHREVERLGANIEVARSRIPPEDHFAEYENDFLSLGEDSGLWDAQTGPKIRDTTRRGAAGDGGVRTRTMTAVFSADFEMFFGFLRQLETHEKLTRIESINIEPDPEDPASGVFRITLRLTIFYGEP